MYCTVSFTNFRDKSPSKLGWSKKQKNHCSIYCLHSCGKQGNTNNLLPVVQKIYSIYIISKVGLPFYVLERKLAQFNGLKLKEQRNPFEGHPLAKGWQFAHQKKKQTPKPRIWSLWVLIKLKYVHYSLSLPLTKTYNSGKNTRSDHLRKVQT